MRNPRKYLFIIGAILSIILTGILAYYLSGGFIKSQVIKVEQDAQRQDIKISLQQVKDLKPDQVRIEQNDWGYTISFSTSKPAKAHLYITPDAHEDFVQAVKDFANGLGVSGQWYHEKDAVSNHTFQIKTDTLPKPQDENTLYMYILIETESGYIPYGKETSLESGPLEPWIITLPGS